MADDDDGEPLRWRMLTDVAPWWVWLFGTLAVVPLVLGFLIGPMFFEDWLGDDGSVLYGVLFMVAGALPMVVVLALARGEARRRR